MLDTFKAKLLDSRTIPSNQGRVRQAMPNYPICTFTKDSILFPKIKEAEKRALSQGKIYDRSNYTINRLNRHDHSYSKDSKFQAVFSDLERYNLGVNIWNGILLRIVHQRYSIQKHWEWYWKTIVTLLFGAVLTYFATKFSYSQGFKDGLMEGKKQLVPNPSTQSKTK